MSSEAEPSVPKKRKLTPSPDDHQTNPLSPSSDIYLKDGNIVIVAECTAFRVHQSQLARHSEVFHDMFSVADQSCDKELYDGCPVVKLSDSGEDLKLLLKTLYGDTTRFDAQPFPVLASLLTLATKYLIAHLRESILGVLREAYPDNLNQWDEYNRQRPDPQQVIVLARRVNAEILLPAAFYHLCSFSSKMVMKNCTMPLTDIALYYIGKDEISDCWPAVLRDKLNHPLPCMMTACSQGLRSILKKERNLVFSYGRREGRTGELDPLQELEAVRHLLDHNRNGMCPGCALSEKDGLCSLRSRLWQSLPGKFGLGDWETLRKVE